MEYYRTLLILTFLLLINSANAGFLDKIFGEENKKDNKKNDNEKKENENKPNSSDDGIEPNKPVSEEKGLVSLCLIKFPLKNFKKFIMMNKLPHIKNYLQEFGYVEPGQLSSKGMAAKMEDAVKSAVTKFQEFAGLPVTGSLFCLIVIRQVKLMALILIRRSGCKNTRENGGKKVWHG